jgi:hypothetical protein
LFGTTGTRLLKGSRVPILAVPEVTPVHAAQESDSLRVAA